MAYVVELFGAPGSGKTSLMHALDGCRVGPRRIVTAERLSRVPRGGMLGRLRDRQLTPAERRATLAARADDWEDLLAMAAAAPAALAADPLRALHATGWLAATLELRALADAAPDDVIVVLDEGLAQRAGVVCGPEPDDATLARYVRAFPPTALHVHLREHPAMLAGRLRGRDRTIDRHVGLDDDALLGSVTDDAVLLARCAAALERAGHRMLTTTSGRTTDLVAADVVDVLGSLA